MEPPPEDKPSAVEQMKYYTTLLLGTTACFSSFIFMFCIPWVLDPSISTLMAKFDPEPVVCKTIQYERKRGNKNCTWSSCKHGCTTDLYDCDQIYVNYMDKPYKDWDALDEEGNETLWVGQGLPLLINIKACGYPPHTNCSNFTDSFNAPETFFPCYYSRVDRDLVIQDYSWFTEVQNIIMALLVPNLLCGVSLGVVSYWWYPGCQKRRCQYQLPPDQEDASFNTGNDDEDEDEEDEDEDGEGGKEPDKNDNETTGKKSRVSEDEEKELDTTINMPEEKV